MEHFRGHAWLQQYRQKLPRHWVLVRTNAAGEYFEDGRALATGSGIAKSPCAGCGKGAGPGSKPKEIEAMLRGD